jgi:predicted Holliday junction resolvase-like endonuclease
MSLFDELSRQKSLQASCPHCEESFPLAAAQLFDARRPLEGSALEKLKAQQEALAEGRAELKARREKGPERSRVGAESGNIGKVVEKVAPSLPGFSLEAGDCRALFEPIDYVVFNGLTRTGRIDSLRFVDVKSQGARLNARQKLIRAAVEAGKVTLVVADPGGEP